MTKLKQPLLSLGASGSLGDTLTLTRRRHADIAEKKPIPFNPKTLPQTFQRWLYQDYAYLWTQQSAATKAIYAAKAARTHSTPIAQWLSYYLSQLPDITTYWKLTEGAGTTAYDSSKNNLNATIFGASWTRLPSGLYALNFDGLDDKAYTAPSSSLAITQAITLGIWYTPSALPAAVKTLICIGTTGNDGIIINTNQDETGFASPGWVTAWFYNTDWRPCGAANQLSLNTPAFIMFTYNRVNATLFVNGTQVRQQSYTGAIKQVAAPIAYFSASPAGQFAPGLIALPRIRTTAFTPTRVANHFNNEKLLL